jgi:hypothetical protein
MKRWLKRRRRHFINLMATFIETVTLIYLYHKPVNGYSRPVKERGSNEIL